MFAVRVGNNFISRRPPALEEMKRSVICRIRGSLIFAGVALALFIADRLTKIAVMENIPWERGAPTYHFSGESKPIEVIDGFLYIVHITNEGAAWGMLSGQTYLLSSIAVLALAAMWFFRRELELDSVSGQVCAGMFAGGVVGNLADRILYGHVIDFIDVHLPVVNYRWPAFNVADCGICVGVCVYIVLVFVADARRKRAERESAGKS